MIESTLTPVLDTTLGFISMPGGTEWIILLVLGLLIFGRRLPEVGRSLGRGIVEFKRGVKGIEDEIDDASTSSGTLKPASDAGRLEQQAAGTPAGTAATSSTASVGGESENPYAPKTEPPSQ